LAENRKPLAHPWMANSHQSVQQEMLQTIGAATIAELFSQIPQAHRLKRPLELPPQLNSEIELHRHVSTLLSKNEHAVDNLSFLGAGCWQHYVPAVVDEIIGRTEFLTPVWGSPQSDHGRNQAWFEYASQMGELLNMEVVQLPVYSWGCAAGHAIRMASRITGRHEVLVPKLCDPERLAVIRTYCEPMEMANHIAVQTVGSEKASGRLDGHQLQAILSDKTAAVYVEQPSYLGVLDDQMAAIAAACHAQGALLIVGCDPISLGVLKPPADYGADIAVGPTQPLGVHMNCGGGVGGFMASRDDEKFVREYNGFLVSITGTTKPGEFGFALACSHQTSYGMREKGKDWTGNSVYLWAIANAVYLSLLGPSGMREVGELIINRSHYAAARLAAIAGTRVLFTNAFFKEFVVNFDGTGKTVAGINAALRQRKIFGGKDLSQELPELGQSALYCVTEIHTQQDIDRLAGALQEVISA
jgi:glycine dehydrogenase subunit 1